jgi:hypothetical protein
MTWEYIQPRRESTYEVLCREIKEMYPSLSSTMLEFSIRNYLKQQEDAQYQRPDSNKDSH